MIEKRIALTPAGRRALRLAELVGLDEQIARERRRQRGWRLVRAGSGRPPLTSATTTIGMAEATATGELVYGPPGAHLEGLDRC